MKLWRNIAFATVAAAMVAACSKQYHASEDHHAIVIDPTVTRATELNFENGDRIGVTVIKTNEHNSYIANSEFVNNGTVFTGNGINWYSGVQSSDIRAYYPYDSAGEPAFFTVKTDQRGNGYTQSDFMTARKSGVTPAAGAVSMIFRHRLAKINIEIENGSSSDVTEAGLLSCRVRAGVDMASDAVTADEASPKADITACETTPHKLYNAIIVPQRSALTFYVKLEGVAERRTVSMTETDITGGKQFTARISIQADRSIELKISSEIEGWGDNSYLTPDSSSGNEGNDDHDDPNNPDNPDNPDDPKEQPDKDGTVNWGGTDYPVVTLADGSKWMGANLRYLPSGKSPSATEADNSGVWYPCNTGSQPETDETYIKEHGYLYNSQTAHGGTPKTGTGPVRGICPEGWHLPTAAEVEALKTAYGNDIAKICSELGTVASGCLNALGKYAYSNGEIFLWCSDVTSAGTGSMRIVSGDNWTCNISYRNTSYAASVRCVKDM